MVTPLERAANLSDSLGSSLLLKREDLQPVFSFKLRGAYNKMAALPREKLDRGVITSSAGNHAQGVALAAKKLVRRGRVGRSLGAGSGGGPALGGAGGAPRTRASPRLPVPCQHAKREGAEFDAPTVPSLITPPHLHSLQGCQATICMPVTTPDIKVANVRRLGGTVELVGESYQEAQGHALAVRPGWQLALRVGGRR